MDPSFQKKKLHELVLYQAVIHNSQRGQSPALSHANSTSHTLGYVNPLEISPTAKQVVKKLTHQVFYQSDWWSAIHLDKGLIIDLQV